MMREARYLGKHVLPDVSEGRFVRQFTAVREGLHRGAPRRWLAPSLAAAAIFALALAVVGFRSMSAVDRDVLAAAVIDSDESGATGMRFDDGSSFVLERGSRASIVAAAPSRIELRLERGSVSVDVADPEHRAIRVTAGGNVVAARGRGPRLCFVVSLAADGGDATVSVTKGNVDVTLPSGGVRPIGEGEAWSSARASASSSAPAPSASSASTTSFELDDAPVASPRGASRRLAGPKDFLEDAQQALADGRPKDAAKLFDTIRRRHRGDPRAALAAFELGRIRLDHFGDAPGAEEAFRDALTLSPVPSIREDAEARRVQALDRMGAHDRCISARDAYLARFPSGIHKGAVGASCGGR